MSTPSASGPAGPCIHFPPELPISARREEIARAIADHPVVIVAGETGSGKTTQLPKICLELGRGQQGLIGHTQPRRLAARAVAARIASELGGELGGLVGFQVRFSDQLSPDTRVKLMTDGIMLGELQGDRLLRRYDTLIIDEAHERSLNIDFLLGYIKRLLPRRPELKVVITSATIDVDSFSRHFDGAPVIEVSGRGYPVTTRYLPDAQVDGEPAAYIRSQVEAIASGDYGERGDVLVFLPGEREIRELARELRAVRDVDVLPLYARLSQSEQNRVFEPGRRRAGIRAVLATNVAETSLTVPGIRYVIDPGEARISRYSARSQLQRLPIEPVSRASADQRQGRCGRIGPGVCLRLYSEQDYQARPAFTDPEIRRTNLAAVMLRMQALGLGAAAEFPFLDPPDARSVRDGQRVLEELGALHNGRLTRIGQQMARMPVDPRLARMVLAAGRHGCMDQMLVIASALSVPDPREWPADKQQQAQQAHARFRHPRSEFMAWLALWQYYEEQRQRLSQGQLRKLCQREFLSFLRMREWRDVHRQLSIACREQGLKPGSARTEVTEETNDAENEALYRAVHESLLSGLLANIACREEGRDFLGARNRRLSVFPGSALAAKPPKWLVAAEIVETSRVYARQVAAIEPAWALQVNPALVRHHYSEPHWQPRRGQVTALKRSSLFGLTLSDRERVHYGPLDPVVSRELMIREGLIPGEVQPRPAFLRHNLALVAELEELEARTRRRDLLAGDDVQFAFYDARLPAEICTAAQLTAWLAREPAAARALHMERSVLLAADPGRAVEAQFPSELVCAQLTLRLSYEFAPGGEADGVSVTVPVALLNRAPRFLFDWLVPGLLRDKCIALVRGLPKDLRKHLVPAPDRVDRVLAQLTAGDADLFEALAQALSREGGVNVSRAQLASVPLDDFYRMNIRVVDAQGRLLAQGRDLGPLVDSFRADTRRSLSQGQSSTPSPAREGILRWDFGALPAEWRFRQAGSDVVAYPALVDRGESAAVVLCDYPDEAALQHRLGLLSLYRRECAESVRYLRKQLLRGNEWQLVLAAADCAREPLLADLIDAALVQAMALDDALPRDEAAFRAGLDAGRGAVVSRATDIEATLLKALGTLGAVRRQLPAAASGGRAATRADIDTQLAALLAPGFLRDTPAEWLAQYPRYLAALDHRLQRYAGQQDKDQRHTALLQEHWQPLAAAIARRPSLLRVSPPAADYRWLHEEFRVSLFAQQLGTRRPVSAKRLEEYWRAVADWLLQHPR